MELAPDNPPPPLLMAVAGRLLLKYLPSSMRHESVFNNQSNKENKVLMQITKRRTMETREVEKRVQ